MSDGAGWRWECTVFKFKYDVLDHYACDHFLYSFVLTY